MASNLIASTPPRRAAPAPAHGIVMDILALGWTAERASRFGDSAAAGLRPGRVISADRVITAHTPDGPVEVIVQRRSRRETAASGPPVVGDWVALEPLDGAPGQAALRGILPRATVVARALASPDRPGGHVGTQVLAANVDVAFLVSAVGHDLNPRRIERYLLMCLAGGVRPVIVLNKSDLAEDLGPDLAAVATVAGDAPVHTVSALNRDGLGDLSAHLAPGVTVCLLGSSGVGKSTMTNALLGTSRQVVRAVRQDDERGRHATTRRELIPLPSGALLIDTPGLRSVGVWGDDGGLEAAFADVERLAAGCRFRDCRHDREPGCAVREAVRLGELAESRVRDLRKLDREVRSLELRSDVRSARAESRRLGRLYRGAAMASRRKGWVDG